MKAVTETLCGHGFSASSISALNKTLDAALTGFSTRRLTEAYPYLILDARYERIREGGAIVSQAVLIAVAVDGEGRRQILAVELANRESRSSWRDFLLALKQRGLFGVEFVVSDDHPGLKVAIREVLPEAVWQRCYVHFLRNALDYVPRKVDDHCLMELRWFYDRRDVPEVRRDLAAWLSRWPGKYPKLCNWVEENIEETLSYYRLPLAHHKHMKSTNMLERLNQEIKRRTHVVRIFPNPASCLQLIRAWRWKPMRTGWRRSVISIWITCGNTRNNCRGRRHEPHAPALAQPGAVLAAVKDASRLRSPAAILDRRRSARRPGVG